MRGGPTRQAELILGVTADSFVPQQHPVRQIKPLVDAELSVVFTAIYARIGRRWTLLQAWASMKSVRPLDDADDGPTPRGGKHPSVDFKGQRRVNETRLAYTGHVLMDNRHGLVVDTTLTQASGAAEKRIEETFGWLKTVACTRKPHCIGVMRNKVWLEMAFAAYNLLRIARIEQQRVAA